MSFFQSLAAAFKGEAVTPRAPLGRSFVSPWVAASDWRGDTARGPINYPVAIREAYLRNPVAQRAVRLVAEGIGRAPVKASDPALLALVSETSAGQPLLETLAAHLMLHGNGYVQVLRDADGVPVELFALRPERVTVIPDAGDDGGDAGLALRIRAVENGWLVLERGLAADIGVGARVILREGCDHTVTTCAQRFANVVNFQGEPYLPGNDLLTRYPVAQG